MFSINTYDNISFSLFCYVLSLSFLLHIKKNSQQLKKIEYVLKKNKKKTLNNNKYLFLFKSSLC